MERKATFSYIKAIAEMRSISLAAEHLGISQPALSSYLKKQEKELGTVLFDRSKQPLEPTEAGRVYIEYLDRAMALHKEFSQNIADLEGMKTGKLTVGGASFFNVSYLPKAVAEFSKEFPGISIEIVDGKVPELTSAAQKGMLDLFITPIVDEEERFSYEELLDEDVYLAVPADWKINEELASKEVTKSPDAELLTKEEFEKLCEHTFIVLKKNQHIGRVMEALFRKFDCRPEKTVTAEQTMTTLALTSAGVGISLITESSIKNGNMKQIPAMYLADRELCHRKMFVAYPRNKYLSRAAAEFIRILKEVNMD